MYRILILLLLTQIHVEGACQNQGTFESQDGTCLSCPGGWYIGDDNTERSSCTRCGPGEYQHESGSSWCDRCEKGKYNGHVAKTSCKDCKSGQFETEYKSHFCQ